MVSNLQQQQYYSRFLNNVPKQQIVQNKPVMQQPIVIQQNNSQQNQQKPSRRKGLLATIIGTSATLAIGAFLFTRGGGSKFANQMNKLINALDDKIYNMSKNGNKAAGFLEKSLLYVTKGVKKGVEGLKLLANFTPVKDIACDRLFRSKFGKFLRLDKFADYTTDISRRMALSRKVALSGKALTATDEAIALIRQKAKQMNISNKNLDELLKKLQDSANETIGATGRLSRQDIVEKTLNGVDDDIAKQLGFDGKIGVKEIWENLTKKGYLTESLATQRTGQISNELTTRARSLTNNFSTNKKEIREIISTMRTMTKSEDKETLDILRKLAKEVSSMTENSNQQQIINLLNQIRAKHPEYAANINFIQDTLQYRKGTIQELMDLTDTLFGKDKNDEIRMSLQNASHKIQQSVKCEKNAFLREAELKVGAAATDWGFLGLTGGAAILNTALQDDNDKRVKKGLTTGIPVLIGLGTCLSSTYLGLTGITGLSLGLLTGKIGNVVGSSIANQYDNYNNNKSNVQDILNKYNMLNGQGTLT